ncbi:MAG TPA: branched-chain amino acid ABC transporter permease [Acidimicrobiia bacterium]|nr:branched-chain amino acid ABC transporter permease [Acidimicrobiia bacterium]
MTGALGTKAGRFKLLGLVVAIAAGWSVPYVFSNYQVSLTTLILISAMLATSINFMAGNVGLVSVGHAGIAATAGYGLAWSFAQGHGLGTQLLIALALTLVASFVFGLTSMRTSGIFFLMATLALGMVVFGLSYRMSAITGGENGLSGIRRPELFSSYWMYYFLVLVVFVVVTAAIWVVTRSPFGTALRGIRESESRMESLGYNVAAYKLGAMMISGVVAGIAGVLSVWLMEFVSPASAGFLRSALATLMVILGGVGTFLGPLTGATIVSWIEHVLSTYIERWPTVLGLIFIVVIVFAPDGIGGAVRAWWQGRRRRSDREVARSSGSAVSADMARSPGGSQGTAE